MTEQPEFKEAGAFLKRQRKDKGFKTQKSLIAALKSVEPEISCSESYISLIEKGVKTPGVHLLDLLAQVLELSASEKGELLLIYKRVPSDFEFAVRDNLKAAAQLTRLDRIREQYQSEPSREHFNHLLKALILEDQSQEALELLKQAPTFDNEVLELQERTAKIAIISGNFSFARQAFDLALENCQAPEGRADILLYKGMAYFHEGLTLDPREPDAALECYLQAQDCFGAGLALVPDNLLILDEQARCAYHIGDSLLQRVRQGELSPPSARQRPDLARRWGEWFGKKTTLKALQERSQAFFALSREAYGTVLSRADLSPLPDKPMKEAVFFYAYVHAKLKLFPLARVLIHSNLILERNWLTCFMKAGISLMEYEAQPDPNLLEQALYYLEQAFEQEPDAVCDLMRQERKRELKLLWEQRPKEMEALLKQYENQ